MKNKTNRSKSEHQSKRRSAGWHWKGEINKTRQKDWDRSNTQEEWKTKSKTKDRNISSIEIVRWFYHIAWNIERIKGGKTQESQRLVMENSAFVKVSSAHQQKIRIYQKTGGQWIG